MDVRWIKITSDILNDNKMKLIDSMPERDAVFRIWIGLLSLAGQCNNFGMVYLSENFPYTDEMLSTLFNRPVNIIRLALDVLDGFGMIEILDNGILVVTNWEKHQNIEGLDKIREQNKIRAKKYREKLKEIGGYSYTKEYGNLVKRDGEMCIYCGSVSELCIDHLTPVSKGGTNEIDNLGISCKKCNSGKSGRTPEEAKYEIISDSAKKSYKEYVTRTVTLRHATDKNRIDKTRVEKNIYPEGFDSLWALYPNKNDKRACYNKFLKTIKDGATIEDLSLAVQHYAESVKGKETRFIKHGKTFFGVTEVWRDFVLVEPQPPTFTGNEPFVEAGDPNAKEPDFDIDTGGFE